MVKEEITTESNQSGLIVMFFGVIILIGIAILWGWNYVGEYETVGLVFLAALMLVFIYIVVKGIFSKGGLGI